MNSQHLQLNFQPNSWLRNKISNQLPEETNKVETLALYTANPVKLELNSINRIS